jgi:hypothetical protein
MGRLPHAKHSKSKSNVIQSHASQSIYKNNQLNPAKSHSAQTVGLGARALFFHSGSSREARSAAGGEAPASQRSESILPPRHTGPSDPVRQGHVSRSNSCQVSVSCHVGATGNQWKAGAQSSRRTTRSQNEPVEVDVLAFGIPALAASGHFEMA